MKLLKKLLMSRRKQMKSCVDDDIRLTEQVSPGELIEK